VLATPSAYWGWILNRSEAGVKVAGNAIDFYTKVLGASFHDAMKELSGV